MYRNGIFDKTAVRATNAQFLSEHECESVMSLLQEMDLIEVLWKQDVDLGFSLEIPNPKSPKTEVAEDGEPPGEPTTSLAVQNDDIEKLKALKAVNEENIKVSRDKIS